MLGLSTSSLKPRRVHIIGAGLAGLSCAIKLVDANVPVILYEAAPHAGGRCRSYEDKQLGCTLDNGNHLILRGNKASWSYIHRLKTFGEFYAPTREYIFHDTTKQRQWTLQPPFIAQGWQGLRLLFAQGNKTVAQLFDTNSQFYCEFVEPLCIGALNTHPEQASATTLRNVWLHTLLPSMADYLQIRTDFNRALIAPALSLIGNVKFQHRLKGIELDHGRITALNFNHLQQKIREDERVVLALPPEIIASLLPSLALPTFKYHAIINGHFLFDTDELAPRLLGVLNSPLHWVFLKEGIISTTTSHAERTSLWNKDNIAEVLWKELGETYSALAKQPLPPHRIITEKRATIAATPHNLAKRPSTKTNIANLALAGDWLASPYPACIENTIQSGEKAALQCLASVT